MRAAKDAILEQFYLEQELATTKREQYSSDSAERMAVDDVEAEKKRERLSGVASTEVEAIEKVSKAEQDAAKAKKKAEADKLNAASGYVNAASSLNTALFEDNKAIGAGVIVADTAIAISKANALGYPLAIPAMAAAAANGVAQLAAINSASKGGGSISGGGVATVSAPEAEATSQLSISDTDVSGAGNSQNITISIEGGDDELAAALSGILDKAKINGRI